MRVRKSFRTVNFRAEAGSMVQAADHRERTITSRSFIAKGLLPSPSSAMFLSLGFFVDSLRSNDPLLKIAIRTSAHLSEKLLTPVI